MGYARPRGTPTRTAFAFVAVLVSCGGDAAPESPQPPLLESPLTRFVDPFIGTSGRRLAAGSAYPGPAMPFGMVHPGPDTRQGTTTNDLDHCSGYNFLDDEIITFSHLRMHGTGAPGYGMLGLMPTVGFDPEALADGGYGSTFTHDTEVATPGYYSVALDRDGVVVELTAAERTAVHRYTYPAGAPRQLIVDASHAIGSLTNNVALTVQMLEDQTVVARVDQRNGWWTTGRDQTAFFAVRADTPITRTTVWDEDGHRPGTQAEGVEAGMVLAFAPSSTPITVKVGVSFTSTDAAIANMAVEVPAFDFEAVRAAADLAWEDTLGRVEIAGGTADQHAIFYTALYHAHLMPTLLSDAAGTYPGFDGQVQQADDFRFYSDMSLWDTFRTQHALVALTMPERVRDFMRSLEAMTRQTGAVPRWTLANADARTMVGDPAALVVAESVAKGITDFDVPFMYEALRRQADEQVALGREQVADYVALGYVPSDASTSLEYAYADWALSGLAAQLDRPDDAARFSARAQAYRNLWDPQAQHLRPKEVSGAWTVPHEPTRFTVRGPYVEGSPSQWRWYVQHDPAGLADLFGSPEAAAGALSEFFARSAVTGSRPAEVVADVEPYYWHGNEPSIHTAYLFGEFGRPDLTQAWTRALLASQYSTAPRGLPGNDDGGTLSAWYVLSALGLYPVAGSERYWTGSPLFERAVIHRDDGDIEIRAPGTSEQMQFVTTIEVDGKRVDGEFLHSMLAEGAVVRFTMTDVGERVPVPSPPADDAMVDAQPCNDVVGSCCSVSTPIIEIPACIAAGPGGVPTCGLDLTALDAVGLTLDPPCQARGQESIDSAQPCPALTFDLAAVLPGADPIEIAGCCRAATRTCGGVMDTVEVPELGDFQADVQLGCISAAPLLDGAPETPCGA